MKVQFLKPLITEEDILAMVRVLRSGWLVLCDETKEFENDFALYLGTEDCVLTNSCLSSLILSLLSAGIKEGDRVITTPISYVASANAILHCKAKPVFVDVDSENGLLDLNHLEEAVTEETKAVLPVHLYGQMVDMRRIKKIADSHGLVIIEDASHAMEAERDGARPGHLSFSACFSFHTAKNITAGQGGAIATNLENVAENARLLRRDGVRNLGSNRRMESLGFKFLLTDYQAALLRSQLKRIDDQWLKRKEIYDRYASAFTKMGIGVNRVVPASRHAYHMFVIRVDPKKRDSIQSELHKMGVETSVHYDPIHLEPFYRKTFGYRKGDFPVAERLGFSSITLPLYPELTKAEQEYVIEAVARVI